MELCTLGRQTDAYRHSRRKWRTLRDAQELRSSIAMTFYRYDNGRKAFTHRGLY
jgi:hypothetical protein